MPSECSPRRFMCDYYYRKPDNSRLTWLCSQKSNANKIGRHKVSSEVSTLKPLPAIYHFRKKRMPTYCYCEFASWKWSLSCCKNHAKTAKDSILRAASSQANRRSDPKCHKKVGGGHSLRWKQNKWNLMVNFYNINQTIFYIWTSG